MQCVDCKLYNININCNTPNIKDILSTKLPLELIYKIEFYYYYSNQCFICKGMLCYTHSQEASFYNDYYTESKGFMCNRCCPIRYIISNI